MSVTMRFGQLRQVGEPFNCRADNLSTRSLESRIRAAVRRCVAEEIERLLLVLDGLDVDADYEDGSDAEPSLGWRDVGRGWSFADRDSPNDDREEDVGDEGEPDENREPALGWTEDEDQTNVHRMSEPWRWEDEEA